MFRKAKSVTEDSRMQPLQRSAVTQPAAAMLHPSETISSIGSEMAVIGKITCKGALKIYGLVEGEVIASNAFIADGARIQGEIVAEELTIAGRVKGNIHALRVKLQATAVVEGDISHRSLSIDEHAWFEGRSVPEDDDPPEQRSSVKVESSAPQPLPQALVASDDQGEFKSDYTEEEPTWLPQKVMHAFLPACIAIISIGVVSYFALNALQQPGYTIDNGRIDPGSVERSTQLGSTEPLSGLESAAVRTPETPQAAPVLQNAPETIAPKARDTSLDPEQATAARVSAPETPQAAPVLQNAPETIAPKARDTSLDPEQATAARVSAPETPQAAPVLQNAPETIAPEQATAVPASTPKTPQPAPVLQNAPETIAPEQATAVPASTPETPQAAPVLQNAAQPMKADASREAGEPIMAIVSIKTQQVTFYDADGWIYRAPVSTGRTGRETPAGVFAVLEKDKDHHSSLYDDAWMPNMLRITWNGLALHGGPLPGYAASHGCVRMPYDFAEKVFDKAPMGMRVIVSPSAVEPVEFSSSSLFMPNRETIAAMPTKATALAREADEATTAAATAKTALGSAKRGADAAATTVRKLEYFKKRADGELADAEKVLAAARTDAAKAAAENVKQKATAKIEELSTQLDAAMADERTTQNAVVAAEAIAKTTEAKRIEADKAANDAKLALEPISVYISRATQKLYVRRDTHMRAPDGGEMYDTTVELPVTIKNPDKPIGTHIFTVVARTDAGLRWTEVTIDNGDDAKDALNRITLPQEILDRIAPTAMPRSSIIISDEPLSSETNYRTEFVVVLNDQPQGGFANRARSPYMRFARRDGFGFNRLGDWFLGDSRPPRGQRRQGWGWGSY